MWNIFILNLHFVLILFPFLNPCIHYWVNKIHISTFTWSYTLVPHIVLEYQNN